MLIACVGEEVVKKLPKICSRNQWMAPYPVLCSQHLSELIRISKLILSRHNFLFEISTLTYLHIQQSTEKTLNEIENSSQYVEQRSNKPKKT